MFVGASAAKVEPTQRPYRMYIGGTLAPDYGHLYGPFGACILIQVSVTWTPPDQYLFIGISENETGPFVGHLWLGGVAYEAFGGLDMYKNYYILIWSPYFNTKDITYYGYITYWRPW